MWHNSEIIKTTVENSKNVNLYINIFLLIKSIHFTAFSLLRFYGLINAGTCWLLHFKMFKRQPFERHKAWKASKQTVTRDLENHSTIAFTFVLLFLLVLFHRCQRSKQCSESAASVDEGRERERAAAATGRHWRRASGLCASDSLSLDFVVKDAWAQAVPPHSHSSIHSVKRTRHTHTLVLTTGRPRARNLTTSLSLCL